MTDSNKFGVQILVNSDDMFNEERKEYIIRSLREDAARKLAEQITDGNRYVVRLQQSVHQNYYDVILRYEWEITAVQYQQVKMYETPNFADYNWKLLSTSAIEEIKYRITKWISITKKNIWHNINT